MSSQATNEYDAGPATRGLADSWQVMVMVVVGAATLVVGLVVTFNPTGTLDVLVVLAGVLMILSGIFHLVRMFDRTEGHRVWLGVSGLLFVVLGIVLIRNLNLTVALVGLMIGITWVVQGIAALIGGIAGRVREGRAWWIVFGVLSLVAGIVVVSAPAASLSVLAALVGIWFAIMGVFEVVGGLLLRRRSRTSEPAPA